MSNLPDDVTHGDIDDHYAAPDMAMVHGSVSVAVSAEVAENASDKEMRSALREAVEDGYDQVLSAEIGEVVPRA